jgi:hypothetical protein
MAEEEFTDDDFEDLPPTPIPGPTRKVIRPANPKPTPAPVAQQAPPTQAIRDAATPTEKYAFYSIPPRMGIFDNEIQKPVIEESELTSVLLTLLIKVANDVDEIKGRL